MIKEELKQLISEVQKRQSEFDHVEVKAARGGTPKRLYEPLSAFANRTGGGVLLFGLVNLKIFQLSALEMLIGYRRTYPVLSLLIWNRP